MDALDLRLRDISEDGQDLSVHLDAPFLKDALAAVDADIAQTAVEATLHLQRLTDTVHLRGHLTGDVKVPCARCLGEAWVHVRQPLHVIAGPKELGAEDSLDEEIEYVVHDGVVLHVGEMLRESLILSVPMSTLCREECRGLCPVCGADKNENDCGHSPVPPDPRLAALRDIKL